MIWDGLIVVVAVILAVNGWKRGLINSWRGPIAIILATVTTKHFYIAFATWLVKQLCISNYAAVLTSYIVLWLLIVSMIEIILNFVLHFGRKQRPAFFDRLGGAFYGLLKTLVIVILPLMCISADLSSVPQAEADKSGLKVPDFFSDNSSALVPDFKEIAKSMLPTIGQYVVASPVSDSNELDNNVK